jgi:DNA-binding transcriptional ArsR family regulator
MQDESNRPPEMDPHLKRALSHPGRQEILSYLMQKRDGTRTAGREIAEALGLSVAKVRYHLTVLHDAELIAIDEEQGRDETERSYIASAGL